MNTIMIHSTTGEEITYTEAEVQGFIRKAKAFTDGIESIEQLRLKVRDYFNELDYSDGETTVHRDSINELLISIGAERIRTKWTARVTIEATVYGYIAEDEDDAIDCIQNDIEVNIGSSADLQIDGIDVTDVEEE